ncbi:MAG: hypothetical protein AAB455_01175 [Patescibacteria group bacterium]
MLNLNRNILQLAVIVLLAGLGFGYVLAAWQAPTSGPPTSSGPSVYNASEPINVSSTAQIKDGGLGVNGVLSAFRIFSTDKFGVGPSPGGDWSTNVDPTAALDVNGQIRIRGGSPGVNKVLKSDANGLASWQVSVAGLNRLVEGFGIDLADYSGAGGTANYATSSITSDGIIAVAAGQTNPGGQISPATIQQRLTGVPCASPGAITGVGSGGGVTCSSFVTTVTAPASGGLIGPTTPTSGPITLSVNVGPGLVTTAGNQIAININAGTGDGLQISGNQVRFENCANGQTWKYNSVSSLWECANLPLVPGESVVYFKTKSSSSDPKLCSVLAGSWAEVTTGSGLTYTSNEGVGSATVTNKVRVCYHTGLSCQVIYLRDTTAAPACPSGFNPAGPASSEWAPGGTLTNFVNTCYACN